MGLGRFVGRFAVWDLARFKMPGRTEAGCRAPGVYVQSSDGQSPVWRMERHFYSCVTCHTVQGCACVMNAFSRGGCPSYVVFL